MRYLKLLAISGAGAAIALSLATASLAKKPTPLPSPTVSPTTATSPTPSPTPSPSTATTHKAPDVRLSATLVPTAEVPATTAKGSGVASVNVYLGENKVCYRLKVSNLDTPTAAHIHQGPVGQNGPVVLQLSVPAKGTSVGCAKGKPEVIQGLAKNPGGYYVNIHNKQYANGAIRGQLTTAPPKPSKP